MYKCFLILALIVAYETSCCKLHLGDLPPRVISDVIGILTLGVRFLIGNCSNVVQTKNNFWLYERNNIDKPTQLNLTNVHEINPSKPIVAIIHGWMSNGISGWPQDLKNTYLNTDDLNAIVVDWSPYADVIDYTSAVCHVPEVGRQLGDLLCQASTVFGVDLGSVHIVGHSLGAQVAGFAGQHVKSSCGKVVGRISACDPAGPGYQGVSKSKRLDSGDAKFVDVIHTNQGFAGYYGQVGHVDFYPNCGTLQTGCLKLPILNIPQMLKLPLTAILCNHARSYEYYIESVNSHEFKALSCKTCPSFCAQDILSPAESIMGEHSAKNYSSSSYVLSTNPKSLYALGDTTELKFAKPNI